MNAHDGAPVAYLVIAGASGSVTNAGELAPRMGSTRAIE